MIKIIKNCKVFTPEYAGKKDILICGDKIEGLYEDLYPDKIGIKNTVIDGANKLVFPGFIDSHVHIIGGGGEDGYTTRTPEINLSNLTRAGITTVVGCLGTDNICRSINELVAKVKALKKDGISAYCYTGSYEIPVKTLTGSVKGDLLLIEEIIGVGEIAISDHRSSQPTYEEFLRVVSQSRVGGLLSGKCGIVNIHLGDGKKKLQYLFDLIRDTEIPPEQLLPTHINRDCDLLENGIEYINRGGYIDLTTSCNLKHINDNELRAGDALKVLIDRNIDINKVTFTSDGNGSMPNFDEKGDITGFGICNVESLYNEVKYLISKCNVPIEIALKVITSNVADRLNLKNKGRISRGKDADFVIVDEENMNIDTVIAKGKIMFEKGEVLVKGFFE